MISCFFVGKKNGPIVLRITLLGCKVNIKLYFYQLRLFSAAYQVKGRKCKVMKDKFKGMQLLVKDGGLWLV